MQKLEAQHSTICDLGSDSFGYFGWPTLARSDDGVLWIAASGMRTGHLCPNGRTVVLRSDDEGQSWSTPRVIHDSPFDDRDAGILDVGDGRLLVSWFTSDPRDRTSVFEKARKADSPDADLLFAGLIWQAWAEPGGFLGSWVMHSDNGGASWSEPRAVDASAPHGPIRLESGALLYLGKSFGPAGVDFSTHAGPIRALRSRDRGETWQQLGDVPVYPGTAVENYHEPHVVELPGGRLVGHIRVQNHAEHPLPTEIPFFSIMQTTSEDAGQTWTEPQPLTWPGSPPHLMRHSSGTLVCTYSYRAYGDLPPGDGQRVALSTDGGETWGEELILRDDGPSVDLGYPATVELPDGSLLSAYYQAQRGERCALLASRWNLPK